MWIATLSPKNNIINEKLIKFGEGDLLILPYGTLHAGDKNRTNIASYKVFSEVFTETITDSQSQLWVINGSGYTKQKQKFQLGPNRCIPNF